MITSYDPTVTNAPRLPDDTIQRRKELLDFTKDDAACLAAFRPEVEKFSAALIKEFYKQQMKVPEIRDLIDGPEMIERLRAAQHDYILGLFSGQYDGDYAENRLRIGKAHANMGIEHDLFVSSLHRLEKMLVEHFRAHGGDDALECALHKLLLFDLQLVFDTYITGLIGEIEESRDKLAAHARTLEEKVAERTAEILQLARTDPLTGLWNRREFYQRLRHEAVSARRGNHNLSVAFVDIDDFKSMNDTHGHLYGDKILRQVGMAISEITRETDQAFRFGGDEFCLILPFTDRAGAEKLSVILSAAMPDGVGVSIGVAQMQPEDTGTFETLVTRADEQMYAAKNQYQGSMAQEAARQPSA
ncbi:MAG: GGDEF domain-containing protein [Maritimibacter sp.]